jgi:WD40 repeat protein
LLTTNEGGTANLWDAASGKPIGSLGHLGPISRGYAFLEAGRPSWRVHFSPDGARVLTTNADHSAKLWDAASGKLLSSFAHQDEVFQAEFSSDRARILTASRDKTAELWDAASGKLIASFDQSTPTRSTRIFFLSWSAAYPSSVSALNEPRTGAVSK